MQDIQLDLSDSEQAEVDAEIAAAKAAAEVPAFAGMQEAASGIAAAGPAAQLGHEPEARADAGAEEQPLQRDLEGRFAAAALQDKPASPQLLPLQPLNRTLGGDGEIHAQPLGSETRIGSQGAASMLQAERAPSIPPTAAWQLNNAADRLAAAAAATAEGAKLATAAARKADKVMPVGAAAAAAVAAAAQAAEAAAAAVAAAAQALSAASQAMEVGVNHSPPMAGS